MRKTPRASCQEPTTVMHVTISWCTCTSWVATRLATPPPPPSISHAPMQPSWRPFARSTPIDPRSSMCTVCARAPVWPCASAHASWYLLYSLSAVYLLHTGVSAVQCTADTITHVLYTADKLYRSTIRPRLITMVHTNHWWIKCPNPAHSANTTATYLAGYSR